MGSRITSQFQYSTGGHLRTFKQHTCRHLYLARFQGRLYQHRSCPPLHRCGVCQYGSITQNTPFTFHMELHIIIIQALDISIFIGNSSHHCYKVGTIGFQVNSFIIYPKQQLFRTTSRMHFVRSNHFTIYQPFGQQKHILLLFLPGHGFVHLEVINIRESDNG